MQKYQELRDQSKKYLKIADHMITTSYPMFKDPKILLSATKNLLLAGETAITAVLEHERLFKRVPPFHDSLDTKTILFREKVLERYEFEEKQIKLLKHLSNIIKAHQESTIEFPRQDKFVMCSDTYEIRTLSIKDLKEYINQIRSLIEKTYQVTMKNDGIFS